MHHPLVHRLRNLNRGNPRRPISVKPDLLRALKAANPFYFAVLMAYTLQEDYWFPTIIFGLAIFAACFNKESENTKE